jgi:hypothetical protein
MATYYHEIDEVHYLDQADADAAAAREAARLVALSARVNSLNPKRAHLLDGIDDPDEVIRIVGGYIRAGNIPLFAGYPTAAWLSAFCTCDAHTNMRRDKARKNG